MKKLRKGRSLLYARMELLEKEGGRRFMGNVYARMEREEIIYKEVKPEHTERAVQKRIKYLNRRAAAEHKRRVAVKKKQRRAVVKRRKAIVKSLSKAHWEEKSNKIKITNSSTFKPLSAEFVSDAIAKANSEFIEKAKLEGMEMTKWTKESPKDENVFVLFFKNFFESFKRTVHDLFERAADWFGQFAPQKSEDRRFIVNSTLTQAPTPSSEKFYRGNKELESRGYGGKNNNTSSCGSHLDSSHNNGPSPRMGMRGEIIEIG